MINNSNNHANGPRKRALTLVVSVLLGLLTVSLSLSSVAFWHAVDAMAGDIETNDTRIVDLTQRQAVDDETTWTAHDQAAFQTKLFEAMSEDRRSAMVTVTKIIEQFGKHAAAMAGRLEHHKDNDHPPDHVSARMDAHESRIAALEAMARDVAAIKAVIVKEKP